MFETIQIPKEVYTNSFTENNAKRFFYLAVTQYKNINDKAHGIEHAIDVVNRSFIILEKLGLLQFPDVCKNVYVAALFHDVGMIADKKNHHIEGANIVRKLYADLCNITFVSLKLIEPAIQEHRASYKGEYTSIVSQIVSVADRQQCVPGEYSVYKSAYDHQLSLGYNHDEALENAYFHVTDKYGIDGYAYQNNDLYNFIYKDDLEQFKLFVDNVMLNDEFFNIMNDIINNNKQEEDPPQVELISRNYI